MSPGELAIKYTAAHDEWRRLRRLRVSYRCAHEAPWRDCDDRGATDFTGDGVPCWKWHHAEYIDNAHESRQVIAAGYHRDMANWCPSCLQRAAVHASVHAAGQRRNALLGALLRASRRAMP
jgi:hypothetical protein